jgi:xanthine dehydrogenase molybdopterin-binding subunit B
MILPNSGIPEFGGVSRNDRIEKDKLMNILPANMRFGAGQPIKRLEDQRLLTGKGQFIDDRPEDGALWLHVLRSPHAHAKIASIDIKAATEMPASKPSTAEPT